MLLDTITIGCLAGLVCRIREPVAAGMPSLLTSVLVAPVWLRCTTITEGLETLFTTPPLEDTTRGCKVLMAEDMAPAVADVLRPCGRNEAVFTVTTRCPEVRVTVCDVVLATRIKFCDTDVATMNTGDPEAAAVDPAEAVFGRILAPTGYTFIGESPTLSLTVAA